MVDDIERFIQWVRMRSPQAKTWRDYKCDLELFQALVGDRGINEIRPRDIDDFVNDQVQKGYKPSTVNRRLAAVVSLYRFLLTADMVITCPVLPKRHYLREPQRLPRPVNERELQRFFQSIDDPRDRAMFTLMLCCGLRIGEVSTLQLPDLYLGESPSRMIIRGKGSRERTVYVSPQAERALQAWLEQRPTSRDKHVFVSYQQRQLSTTSISERIKHGCQVSGVDLTAHRLRHTFADHLLSAGTPITTIQKLMGHRFVETTQTYALANDRQVQADFYRATEKLEGWKLLFDVAGAERVDIDYHPLVEAGRNHDPADKPCVAFTIPDHVSQLPSNLIQQLEAFRQLKVSRWRNERVVANSILYYSQHGILWRYFVETCCVTTVPDLHLEHVMQFVKSRLDSGCSASTVNGSLSCLRSFLSFLKEDDVLVHPSLENIQRLTVPERLPRYITSEQILRLKNEVEADISLANDEQRRYDALLIRAVFYLFWQGGLRSGEVEMLRFSDFYISTANETKRLFIRDGKWRQGRAVYLTDTVLESLRMYLAARGLDQPDGFVFMRNGMPLRKNFIAQRLHQIGKRIDVCVSPHRLRHTFATQLLNVGCRVTSIQRLLGHTNLNTTMTYARAFDRTVMTDYFVAIDVLEGLPDGAWSDLNISAGV